MSEAIEAAIDEMNRKIYGPQFCPHCDKIQPIQVFELENSRRTEMVGTQVLVTFRGDKVCTVCHKSICK